MLNLEILLVIAFLFAVVVARALTKKSNDVEKKTKK